MKKKLHRRILKRQQSVHILIFELFPVHWLTYIRVDVLQMEQCLPTLQNEKHSRHLEISDRQELHNECLAVQKQENLSHDELNSLLFLQIDCQSRELQIL